MCYRKRDIALNVAEAHVKVLTQEHNIRILYQSACRHGNLKCFGEMLVNDLYILSHSDAVIAGILVHHMDLIKHHTDVGKGKGYAQFLHSLLQKCVNSHIPISWASGPR